VDHRLDALDVGSNRARSTAKMRYGPSSHSMWPDLQIDLPRAHVAGTQRDRATFLAAPQALGLRLELGGAAGHPALELGVQCLELAGLAVELDEDLDLGAQTSGTTGTAT
jgi:hypothetical protein